VFIEKSLIQGLNVHFVHQIKVVMPTENTKVIRGKINLKNVNNGVMSRSRRKPYVKDNGLRTHEYWSIIRREWRQQLKQNYYKDDFDLRKPKEIVNDYDYCDYWWFVKLDPTKINRITHSVIWDEEDVKKHSRK